MSGKMDQQDVMIVKILSISTERIEYEPVVGRIPNNWIYEYRVPQITDLYDIRVGSCYVVFQKAITEPRRKGFVWDWVYRLPCPVAQQIVRENNLTGKPLTREFLEDIIKSVRSQERKIDLLVWD